RTTVGSYRIVTIAAAGPHTFNLRVLTSVATTYNVRPAQGSGLTITTTQANQVVELFGYIDVGKPNGTNGTFQMELDID
ncbi:hypothetical protein, partial [Curtobacterium sp. PsM8]|uniref:hypothetical protein n=1 Tax=Curtobacterium sp. PsM8 TaxID=3030532 RepID=UPI00263AB5F1